MTRRGPSADSWASNDLAVHENGSRQITAEATCVFQRPYDPFVTHHYGKIVEDSLLAPREGTLSRLRLFPGSGLSLAHRTRVAQTGGAGSIEGWKPVLVEVRPVTTVSVSAPRSSTASTRPPPVVSTPLSNPLAKVWPPATRTA